MENNKKCRIFRFYGVYISVSIKNMKVTIDNKV